jgi:YbgC/YbaW family acyl-CoA thioester hydrolase
MAFYCVHKKVHWSDCDAAGIAWFANYLGWFEDVEEELFSAALGRSRQALLDDHGLGMPRVEAHIGYEAPVRIGTLLRVGVDPRIENPRRMRHVFEMWNDATSQRVASGFVRVACVSLPDFVPRDFPADVRAFVDRIQALAALQSDGRAEVPWT